MAELTISLPKDMKADGERFLPGVMHGGIELEHMHRYYFAGRLVAGKVVLDIASGEGYGSAFLAQSADRVIGVDISTDAVAHASAKYSRENLEYLVGTCSRIPLASGSVDVVVSFETIEHHDEHEAMMREIKRVLRPGGILVISSPDKHEYSEKAGFRNPFHVRELYFEEFQSLLGAHFKKVRLYGQRVILGSALLHQGKTEKLVFLELDDAKNAAPNLPMPLYWIAVASDEKLPSTSGGVLEQPLAKLWQDITSQRNAKIAELIQAVAEPDSNLLKAQLSGSWYLQQNPDIAEAGIDPYEHWCNNGMTEGRLPASDTVILARDLVSERERSLRGAIEEKERELGQSQQEFLERQRVLEATMAQTKLKARDDVDAQLRTLAVREHAFAEQLAQLQQAASREGAAQKEATQQQISVLAEQHAQREQSLRGAIEEQERELRQSQQEFLERQRVLEAAMAQTKLKARDDVDAQLRTLAARERAFAEQLAQLQQAASREGAAQKEATQQQISVLAEQHAQREQSLRGAIEEQERELRQSQQESLERQNALEAAMAQTKLKARDDVDAQLRALAERERAFAEQLSQLQQTAREERTFLQDQYSRVLVDLNNRLGAIQSTWSWRLTTPLRSFSALFGIESDFSPIDPHQLSSVFVSKEQENVAKHYPEIHASKYLTSIAVGKDKQKIPTTNSLLESVSPVKTLDELLVYDGEVFVTSAYLTLLGRTPDPQGFTYYLERLRKTHDKLAIIYQIYRGQEANKFNCNIPGLKSAMKRQEWKHVPILGALLGKFDRNSQNYHVLRALQMIEQRAVSSEAKYATELIKREHAQAGAYISNVEAQIGEIFKSFDPNYYLQKYPDVAAAGTNPYEHFIRSGWQEGRQISATINPQAKEAAGVSPDTSQENNPGAKVNQVQQKEAMLYGPQASIQSISAVNSRGASKDIASYFMQPADVILQNDGYTFTRLMHYIWTSRLDLQNAFDIYRQDRRLEYTKWFLCSGSNEYGLPPKVYPGNLLGQLVLLGGEVGERAQSMLDAQSSMRNTTTVDESAPCAHFYAAGANLIGYAFGEFGMGEHVRMVARSLNTSGTPFCIIDQDVGLHGAGDSSVGHWVIDNPRYDTNIFHVNADVFPLLYFKFGESLFSRRYNIGYWAWELSKCPSEFDVALNMVDEVWAISEFVAESYKTRSPVPVITMSLAVTVPELGPSYTKRYYGLPEDAFVFFFTFDAASYLDRKNPIAVVRAFKLAFPQSDEKVHLLLKTMNIGAAGPLWDALLAEINADPRITIMSKRLTREEVLGLNLACDAFVSLHRSEGFGRCVAEAMAYGKPVIVTNYSGTRDFAMEGTACVVNYRLVPVPEGQYPFWKDQVWAEPDIEHAASQMQDIVENDTYRAEIALAGQSFILEHFSEMAVGKRYAKRLASIQSHKLRGGDFEDEAESEIYPILNCFAKPTALFTIASKNYLAFARTLLKSVASIHPEYKLFLCLVDEVTGYFDVAEEPFTIVTADQFGISSFTDMTIRYDIMELNTAVKPFMFRWLFDNTDADNCIYLDPDIRVFSRLDLLSAEFESGASVILTPHISKPLEDGKLPDDHSMLKAGVFNLGFIAVKRCGEAIQFIDWWGRKLLTQGVSDLANNLFTDQKWCDLAPCFLKNLRVLQHPGFNVAYWNLAHRHIENTLDRGWLVNSQPLVFFHFSGINPNKREVVSKHQDRFIWEDIGEDCQALFKCYMDELLANGLGVTSQWPYAYGKIEDSFPIVPIVRLLYRSVHPNPFCLDRVDVVKHLIDLCNQPCAEFSSKDKRITQIMTLIYRLRPDLQKVFNLSSVEGCNTFVEWFRFAGSAEHKLPPSIGGFKPEVQQRYGETVASS